MIIEINNYLSKVAMNSNIFDEKILLPNAKIDVDKIKVIMINEVPPQNSDDWFYSKSENPDYMKTTLSLFNNAGVAVRNIDDILKLGIYITTAVKIPKTAYAVDTAVIKDHLPILQAELGLFPNVKAIMLMGDVAKKAINMIVKAQTKRNLIPAKSTYKIRKNEYFWGDIRVFPSYIMTGGNIVIEKTKYQMVSDDIHRMMKLIEGE